MVVQTATVSSTVAAYLGLRMTADEYFALGETRERYELVDGVVLMSPSPTPQHQNLIGLIYRLIAAYLDDNPIGQVFLELDVHLGTGPRGGDLVYRPDVMFLSREKAARVGDRVAETPDLIVEVVSPSSRRFDLETKKADYERAGVAEYWIIDPERDAMTFYRLESGRYGEIKPEADTLNSTVLEGFILDLRRVRG